MARNIVLRYVHVPSILTLLNAIPLARTRPYGTIGVNIVLFGSYLYISRYKHRARQVKRVIMISAITMFLFSSVHVSLGLVCLIQGFIEFRDAPGGPAAFVADTSAPVNVAKIIIHTINSIIGDSIVVSSVAKSGFLTMLPCWTAWTSGLALLPCLEREHLYMRPSHALDRGFCR